MKRFDCHVHTHKSNIQHRDSTNFENKIIDKAIELGLKGIAITDHAVLSAHVDAIKHMKKLREENPDLDFKLGLGTEIYLVDRDVVSEARSNNLPTKFYHLIVVAKNYEGYRAIAELSSNAWEEAFTYRSVMRVPTYKDYFTEWAKRNAGNVIITSACLGSEFSKLVLDYAQEQTMENRGRIDSFLRYMYGLFKDDFYIEIQPSHFDEQIVYNKLAIQIANAYGIKVVIDTDAHYESLEMKEIHSIYLRSQNAERETEQFYASAYLMGCEELRSYFDYIPDDMFNGFMENSLEIESKITEYDLFRETEVPKTTIKLDANKQSILAPIVLNTTKYPYIIKYGTSKEEIDRTLLQQIEEGIIKKNIKLDHVVLSRINTELESLWEISEKLHQRLSSYYLLTKEIVEIMWLVSLVGVSRGSAGAFYICYLLGITQINPIEYELPDWRHISATRPELPDIDIDTEKGQRANILELVKEKFGEKKVLNICTFKTEGTASAIQTMCRGMGISTEEAQYISSLAVDGMSVKKCLEAYEKDKDATTLIKEMMSYEGLIENVIAIEGLVCGRSVHASGVYIFNDDYHKSNAMMRTPNGQMVTQYDMSCSDYQGGLKLDFLTIEALDRIRKCMELLLKDGVIEDKGNLKATYDACIHPDILLREDKEMWRMLCNGDILDAFQYDSVQGKNAIAKIHPHNFREAMDGNALMRLSCEGEQPIDKYVKHKKNINLWYVEMREAGLTQEEVKVMEEHLLKSYGIAPTQEAVMRLSMDKRISGFDLVWANKLRKAIAKSKAKDMIEEVHNRMIDQGMSLGNRREFIEYVWNSCIVPQLGYAFSEPHLAGYTLILLQEMNLAYRYSQLHWKVACLCVNAGDINEDVNGSTDYGALAKAIGGMEKGFVRAPSINKSELGFKPILETNSALYGLGAINGISNDLANEIIKLRPFTSLDDFIERAVATKIVQPAKMYNLIKAGAFDEFGEDRVKTMMRFVSYVVPDKTRLTTANIPKLLEYRLIPMEFTDALYLYNFKKYVFDKKNLSRMINKTQGFYRVPKDAKAYYDCKLALECSEAFDFDDEGRLILNSKEFDKVYKRLNANFEEWIKSKDALDRINYCAKSEVWNKYCSGSLAKWEMDSISYYTDAHELDDIDLTQYYNIDKFNELPRTPETYVSINPRTGREYKRNKLSIIAGTVVEKNKTKHMVTLNTQYGIVEVKLHKSAFAHFDRKTTEEPSWFARGTKLMIVGFRREESFVPRTYPDSVFSSSVMKIEQSDSGIINIKKERVFEKEEDFS